MPRATSGSHIATSTDATTRPMADANATKPARAFGLTAKIFIASTLLGVAVLGITFGVTSIQANRTADASIHRALSGDQTSGAWLDDVRGTMFMAVGTPLRDLPTAAPLGALVATYQVDDSLAGAIKQATNSDVVFFALDTLNQPVVVGSTVPA